MYLKNKKNMVGLLVWATHLLDKVPRSNPFTCIFRVVFLFSFKNAFLIPHRKWERE